MIITPLGLIVIPIGIILFFKKKIYLYWAIIICSPLFDTSIINLGYIIEKIQPASYFAGLLIIKLFFEYLLGKKNFHKLKYNENFVLIVFCSISLLSLIMPIILKGNIRVMGFDQSFFGDYAKLDYYASSIPLELRRTNLTQYLYLVFMVVSYFNITNLIKSEKQIIKTSIILVKLGLIVTIMGFLYQIFVILGFYNIYNYINYFLKGRFLQYSGKTAFGGQIPRMYTIVGEPSFTASFLILSLSLVFVPLFLKKNLKLKNYPYNYLVFFIFSLGIILCTSTTGYFGLFILLLCFFLFHFLKGRKKTNILNLRTLINFIVIIIFMSISILIFFNFFFDNPISYFLEEHVGKILQTSGVGKARYIGAKYSFDIFLKSPFLGVGYGSHRTPSVFFTLLANTGIIGVVLFMLFNFLIIKKGIKVYKHNPNTEISIVMLALTLVSIIYVFFIIFAHPVLFINFFFYWIVLALISASYKIQIKKFYISG